MARTNRRTLDVSLTYEDYKVMPDDGRRYEIIEGELAVSPTPIVFHQEVLGRLHVIFVRWVDQGAGGKVLLAPTTVILAIDTVVEPDLMWIAPARVPALVADVIHGAPDLVVEVHSPSTVQRDRVAKRQAYARHGVREYWQVDPDSSSLTILALRGRGFHIHASGSGDKPLASAIDPALSVVPRDLFRR